MTSSSNSTRAFWRSWSSALCVLTLCLFASTFGLYFWETGRIVTRSESVTSSGWIAYQAQLEYVKSMAALERAQDRYSSSVMDELELRLELLRSRLPLLYLADEGQNLPEIAALEPKIRAAEDRIDSMIDTIPYLRTPEQGLPALAMWREALAPLGQLLQSVLTSSVERNYEAAAKERRLTSHVLLLPMTLLLLSGTTLVASLLLRARKDRERLGTVEAARHALAEMERNLRAMIQASPAAMVVFDPQEQTIGFINPAAAAMVDPIPAHPDWQRLVKTARRDAPSGEAGAVKMTFAKADGDIISLRGAICPITWEGRQQMLLVLTDTTRLRDADLHLLQAAKVATLGEMATAVAHELNQPLAVIRMAVANAHRHLANGGDRMAVAAKLDRVVAQVDRAKGIIDQVRRYGRAPGDIAQRFHLRATVELAAGFVAEQYRAAGIRLSLQLDLPPEITVAGESAMLEHALVNLLLNARDAFQRMPADRARIVHLRGRVQGQRAVLEVEDSAGGISEDVMARLFEPFAPSGSSAKTGAGLGLSVARNVMRDMNGQITAENTRHGACFTLILPIAPNREGREAA